MAFIIEGILMRMYLENWILAHLHNPEANSGCALVRQTSDGKKKTGGTCLRHDSFGDNETSVTRGPAMKKAGRWKSMDLPATGGGESGI